MPMSTNDRPRRARARRASDSAGDELRVAIQRFVRSFGLLSADQTPCGMPLSPSYAHALMVLLDREERGAPSVQQTLVTALGIDKSNITRLCTKMRSSGHIMQTDAPADGRAWSLALTPAGRKLAERVAAASRSRFDRLVSALPAGAARLDVIRALDVLNEAVVLTRRQEATA
jgi:DNA-binding MarR family transcriptional regulator